MKRWALPSVLVLIGTLGFFPGPASGEHTPYPGLPPMPIEGDPDDLCMQPKEGPAPVLLGENGVPRSTLSSEGIRPATLSSRQDLPALDRRRLSVFTLRLLWQCLFLP